jgi:Tetratricopeptide repeat
MPPAGSRWSSASLRFGAPGVIGLPFPARHRDRAATYRQWAMTQHNLGNALATLGERESGTARLEEAVAAYEAAVSVGPHFSESTSVSLARAEGLLPGRLAAMTKAGTRWATRRKIARNYTA